MKLAIVLAGAILIAIVAFTFGARFQDHRYARTDINHDGVTNIYDLSLYSSNYAKDSSK